MDKLVDTKEQKTILHVAVVTSFITTFMGSALNLSIPSMEIQFGVNAALIGWVVTAYTLAVAATSVPLGKIADATDRRMVFKLGIGLFSLLTIICAFSVNIVMLLILRVLQGFAAAMIFATNNAILISAYPASERGRVLGLSTAAVYIGLSAGPVVGGVLNNYFGWQSIFIATTFISLIALIMAIRGLHGKDSNSGLEKFDFAGNILFMAMVVVTLYGLTNLSVMKYSWIILIAGIGLGVVFALVEKKAADPVIRVSMFSKDRVFTFSNIAALLNYGATFAISYVISIYLQIVMGYSSQIAGIILISMPIVQALFSPMMGKMSDKIQPYKLATSGMILSTIGLIVFSFLKVDSPLWLVIIALVISGFAFALFSSPNTNAIMSCVKKEDYSVANSILATMRTVGHSSSMAIVTIIVGFTLGNTPLTEASPEVLVETLHKSFLVFICLCIAGVFMSMQRKK